MAGKKVMNDLNLSPLQLLLAMVIPAFFTGLPALISAIGAWKDERKRTAEVAVEEQTAAEKAAATAERVSNAWEKLTGEMQERIDKMDARLNKAEEDRKNKEGEWEQKQTKMEARLTRQRKRINYLEGGVQILIKQLESLGATPSFVIEEEKGE